MITNTFLNTMDDNSFSLSQMTHELRNPLTIIYSTLQLIEHQHPEVASYTHWDSLFDDVEFMIELLTRLSAYGHGAAPSFETIHTTPFLRHAALSFAASISSSNIEFTSHIAPELPDLMGDPTLLKEVLINLLKNAFEAIDPEHKDNISGSIHLKAFMRCGKLHITISDSGCGITPEQIDHIFNPFVSFKKGGSGIGLAIVKRIVNSHMGTLDLTSNIGCGTTFSVILPVKKYGTDKPTCETSDMSHNINPGSCNPIIRCN